MIFRLVTLLSLVSLIHAEGPGLNCAPELDFVSLRATGYARYLIEDGVLGPVAQVERILGLIQRVRERDLFDNVLEKMGPAAEVLPRMGDMVHLSEHLTQVNRGYQALTVRCARISDDLRENKAYLEATMYRSDAVLITLQKYLSERPGRDTAWVEDSIFRVRHAIQGFREGCLDNLPPQSKGVLDTLDRILWP